MKIFAFSKSALPWFRISLFYTLSYMIVLIGLPLIALLLRTIKISFSEFTATVFSDRVIHSYYLSFTSSLIAALINTIFGVLIAWILVRYNFVGKKFVNSIIDIPFALPTAVAGISLSTLFTQNGWIGKFIYSWTGKEVSFSQVGIVFALVFIGIPFVIRTVQPVLEEFEIEQEEAAMSLGASRLQKNVLVVLPAIFPSILTGFILAFARGLGEYGSIIFISGNIPMVSEITPLLIIMKLEQYDYAGATSIALVLLGFSFLSFFVINLIQIWSIKRYANN